jgi:hydrogen cyanide synthase HcnB
VSAVHVAVVGAGPAGTRAAQLLSSKGCRVTVVHEGPASGGQIYRRQPPGFVRPPGALYGADARKAVALHRAFDEMAGRIELHSNSTVFNIAGKQLYLLTPSGMAQIPYDRLVLATGAMDRILPMPGWTLPGVFTLGGAQIALKHQACAIGRNVAFVGTGPLLYLVAYQYAKAGATVAGVFDTSSAAQKRSAMPQLLWNPRLLLRGLRFRAHLKSRGVPLHEGIVPDRIRGDSRVSGFEWIDASGRATQIECDAVGLGYGLKPESQLAELLGIRLVFDESQRVCVVPHDGAGRAAEGVYVAGDGVAIAGADAAELSGELAAWSLLSDIGEPVPAARVARIHARLARMARFRAALDRAFPVPVEQLKSVSDGTLLCRCEGVTVGTVRAAIARFEPDDVNRLKALARPGMGRCQGRVCGLATSDLLAFERNVPVTSVGFMRGQAPIKPLPFAAAAVGADAAVSEALRTGFAKEAVE